MAFESRSRLHILPSLLSYIRPKEVKLLSVAIKISQIITSMWINTMMKKLLAAWCWIFLQLQHVAHIKRLFDTILMQSNPSRFSPIAPYGTCKFWKPPTPSLHTHTGAYMMVSCKWWFFFSFFFLFMTFLNLQHKQDKQWRAQEHVTNKKTPQQK